MNIKILLSEEELKIVLSALETRDVGLTNYESDMIEKIKIYIEKKLEDSK